MSASNGTSQTPAARGGPRVLVVTSPLPANGQAITMAPLVRQIESLRRAGVEIDVLEVRGVKRLKYVTNIPHLRGRAAGADLVHAHYGYCGWLAKAQLHKPVVCSFMGSDLLGIPDEKGRVSWSSRLVGQTSRMLARRTDANIVKSAEMAERLAPARSYVIPNGVDLETFQPMDVAHAREQLGWRPDKRYILFPGNPANPRKGFQLAERVMAEAQARTSDDLELVRLWGVGPADVPLTMNACDAMLMMSWLEGSPNVVKEAMASDLPVVSVPVGDVAELLGDVSGCHVGPRDARPLGEALAAVLAQGERSRGREAILRKRLDLDSVATRIVAVYDEVLSRAGATARQRAPTRATSQGDAP